VAIAQRLVKQDELIAREYVARYGAK
jgi:hypothetical protein